MKLYLLSQSAPLRKAPPSPAPKTSPWTPRTLRKASCTCYSPRMFQSSKSSVQTRRLPKATTSRRFCNTRSSATTGKKKVCSTSAKDSFNALKKQMRLPFSSNKSLSSWESKGEGCTTSSTSSRA